MRPGIEMERVGLECGAVHPSRQMPRGRCGFAIELSDHDVVVCVLVRVT
jgi:hypothetical protein